MVRAKPENEEQHREFVKLAPELGCHEDEAKFKETLRKIGAQKPRPTSGQKRKAGGERRQKPR
jgi:hypothetical protein